MRVLYLILLTFLLTSCGKDDDIDFSEWKELITNTDKTITRLSFSNDNFGIGLVSIGSIIRTVDGGNN